MKKITLFICTILSVLITSCSDDAPEDKNFKLEIPKSITSQIIMPRISSLVNKSSELQVTIGNFTTNATITNLEIAQNGLNEITKLYAKLYVFNIGEVKNNFMHRRINFWPVFNISIEKNIEEGNFTKESISKIGSAAKNLPSLNYLLFKYSDNQTILNEYKLNANRANFLTLVTDEFHQNIKILENIWSSNGLNFNETFTNNTTEGLQSSFNQLFNGLYNVINVCKIKKIGKPAGLEKSEHTNAEIVENFYASNSLDLVYNNLVSVEEIFFSTDIVSIASFIKSITKDDVLNDKILATFNTAKNTIKEIQNPLKEAIEKDTEKLIKLHNTLKELLVLMHNDVRSNLSLIITGTDTDGD